MAWSTDIEIKQERRLCSVEGEVGYFHCWEQYYDPIMPSPIGQMYGIVEFSDGIKRVEPTSIIFVDEENSYLKDANDYNKSHLMTQSEEK